MTLVSTTGRQNITPFQLPPAKRRALKIHLYLLCRGWKLLEKSSHVGISQNETKTQKHWMFHRDSLKVKFFSSRTGPGTQLGLHLAHYRHFFSMILHVGSSENWGFGMRIWFGSTLSKCHQHVSPWLHVSGKSLCSAATSLLKCDSH